MASNLIGIESLRSADDALELDNPDDDRARLKTFLMKANDIRKGNVIYYEGKPHLVMDFTHRTPGNLRAFVQVRLRNLANGMSTDHRFSATEMVEEARLDTKEMQVLYADGTKSNVVTLQP